MKKEYLFISFIVFAGLCCWGCAHQHQTKTQITPKQPNIVFLLADDMGYGELGSYGQEVIKTPFLDELAAKGLRFTDFYAGTAVCAPSRAVLMTGKHAGHATIRGNGGYVDGKWGRFPLKKSEVLIPEMLQKAGYQTAMIGKWHLDHPDDLSTWAFNRGFDFAVQEQWSNKKGKTKYDERVHWINGKQDSVLYNYKNYDCLDEFRTNFALEFLEKKEKDKPFFLYMSYRVPHANEYDVRKNELYNDQRLTEYNREYASRITMFDQQVKRLYDALEKRGELENTLIVFTSDNGPWSGTHRFKKHLKHSHLTFKSSAGLKGYKRDLYEGGIRVPCIAVWKNKIRKGESNHPSTFYDLMPTFAEVAKTEIPKQTDGISFLSELLGGNQPKHDFLYWEIHNNPSAKGFRQATRFGNWKAVRYGDSYKTELYDLEKDRFEEHDVATKFPDILAKANEILKRESVPTVHYKFAGGIFENQK